jgi:hypothetical protein
VAGAAERHRAGACRDDHRDSVHVVGPSLVQSRAALISISTTT